MLTSTEELKEGQFILNIASLCIHIYFISFQNVVGLVQAVVEFACKPQTWDAEVKDYEYGAGLSYTVS